jgi:hypothetical protein
MQQNSTINVGLEINISKTKEIIFNNNRETQPFKLNNEEIETVNDFQYLGYLVAASEKDIKCRKGYKRGVLSGRWKNCGNHLFQESATRSEFSKLQSSQLFSMIVKHGSYLNTRWTLWTALQGAATGLCCYSIKRLDYITNDDDYRQTGNPIFITDHDG